MAIGRFEDIAPETVVHRVGGGNLDNLRLSPLEEKLIPPGISVFWGGTPQEAAAQMRQAFPQSQKWHRTAHWFTKKTSPHGWDDHSGSVATGGV